MSKLYFVTTSGNFRPFETEKEARGFVARTDWYYAYGHSFDPKTKEVKMVTCKHTEKHKNYCSDWGFKQDLEAYKRSYLGDLLGEVTEEQLLKFHRTFKGGYEEMPEDKLVQAIESCEQTIKEKIND